jgi:hypothetical protein
MQPVHGADNLTTFMCRLSWNVGASTSWNPQGLFRPVTGLLYLYLSSILVFQMYNIWTHIWTVVHVDWFLPEWLSINFIRVYKGGQQHYCIGKDKVGGYCGTNRCCQTHLSAVNCSTLQWITIGLFKELHVNDKYCIHLSARWGFFFFFSLTLKYVRLS